MTQCPVSFMRPIIPRPKPMRETPILPISPRPAQNANTMNTPGRYSSQDRTNHSYPGTARAYAGSERFSAALDVIAHKAGGSVGGTPILRNLEVYVAGLDLDAWARPFGPMPHLLAIADRVEKFMANCFQCGQDARFTQKIGGSGGRIEVGADDLYEARCVACWTPPL